jgi:UDP-3-O-[3-hydroxymyristoyl] glucosamine N-acyltransferase
MKSYSVQEINEVLKGEIVGTTSHLVTAPEQLEASETEISFIGNKKYEKYGPTQGLCCQ